MEGRGDVYRIIKVTKDKGGKGKEKEMEGLEGIESKLIKPGLIIDKYFRKEKEALESSKVSESHQYGTGGTGRGTWCGGRLTDRCQK